MPQHVIDYLNRPIVRIPSCIVTFAVLMAGIVWISSGVLE